jgi:hypothetical protein
MLTRIFFHPHSLPPPLRHPRGSGPLGEGALPIPRAHLCSYCHCTKIEIGQKQKSS